MSERKNMLRPKRNKAVYIYFGVIGFLLLFLFVSYVIYLCMVYAQDKQSIGINDAMAILEMITAPKFDIPFSFALLGTILKYHVTKAWWVYALVGVCVLLGVTSNTKDPFRGMEQGSARWAYGYERDKFRDISGIPLGHNFYVTIENADHKSYSPHNLNEAVIGGSGAGKSLRKIEPDIMQMFGSYVVTDPKGELFRNCSKFLKAAGYQVRVLNLMNIEFSDSYNPFAYMTSEQDCINVASLFMANSAGDGEKADFWSGSAEDMLVAIMVYLYKTEGEMKCFGRVIRLVNSVRYKDGKIDPSCELAQCFEKHKCYEPQDVVTVNWSSMQGTPEETLGSICKTLSTRLRLWATADVDELTTEDGMDFDSIGETKTVIFLIVPAARQTYKTVANIFYSQLFERLMYIANTKHNGRLPMLVSCELDEFANIGEIPNFAETLAVVRSYNIRICIVLQGLSQLKAHYEKTWESILGNCSLLTFLGTNDGDSNEYIANKIGKTTVRVDARSYNRGNQGGGSDSESYVARDLLSKDEIPRAIRPRGKTRRYGGSCILFIDEYYPFFIEKYDTLRHPVFEFLGSDPKYSGVANNTNIEEVYAPIKAERSKHHKQVRDYFEEYRKRTDPSYQPEQLPPEDISDEVLLPTVDVPEDVAQIQANMDEQFGMDAEETTVL